MRLMWAVMLAVGMPSPEFKVVGERIDRNGSFWGKCPKSGDDYRIEKGSSTIGFVKKRGSKWEIESSGNKGLGWLNGDRIEKPSGSTWTSLSDAKKLTDGPDPVAAAMWVLRKSGKF